MKRPRIATDAFSDIAFLIRLSAVACLAIMVLLAPKWTVDDAYITYRYAQNLARHGELNWNVGQDPVEGYTGVAWPVILSGFCRLIPSSDGSPRSACLHNTLPISECSLLDYSCP
jgi:hypothetical protein